MWLHWVLHPRASQKVSIRVLARSGVSSEGSAGEGSASKLTWLLAALWSSGAGEMKASVPGWLLARAALGFLAHGPL